MTAPLNIDKFRKMDAQARSTTFEHERRTARALMEALASRAGMSIHDASVEAGTLGPGDDVPHYLDPEWQELYDSAKYRDRRRELATRYGSDKDAVEACFKETEQEAALRQAAFPFVVRASGTASPIGSLSGWQHGPDLPDPVKARITAAYPMPMSVKSGWTEMQAWKRLHADRVAFEPYYQAPIHDRAREQLLEALLDTLPAVDLEDVESRFEWMEFVLHEENLRDANSERVCLKTLRKDVRRLQDVQIGHPKAAALSNKERRASALSILATLAGRELSNRAISRRVGMSATTIGRLRAAQTKCALGLAPQ